MDALKLKIKSDISKLNKDLNSAGQQISKTGNIFKNNAHNISKAIKDMSANSAKNIEKLGEQLRGTLKGMQKFTVNTNKLSGGLRRLGVDANRTAKEFVGLEKALGGLSNIVPILGAYKITQYLSDAVQSASDLAESINLFNVAMGQYAVVMGQYMTRISQATGVNSTILLDATGNFNLLARSMGLTEKNAAVLSSGLVNLAFDLSSLVNAPLEQVFADLRSGLVGQTETLTKYGIDITDAALKQEALRLGIEKSTEKMTQGEKVMLRYSVMTSRGAIANQDFARTVESVGNQMRLLKSAALSLMQSIGNLAMKLLGPILPYITGIILALKALIDTFAIFLGITPPKFENMTSNVGSLVDQSNNFGSSVDDNKGKVDKLKKAIKNLTLGFDELNVIREPEEPSPSGGGVGGVGGIGGGQIPLPDLTEYSAGLENIRTKATEIRDRIMEWLGFTKKVNEETGEITWEFNPDIYRKLEKLMDMLGFVKVKNEETGELEWRLKPNTYTNIEKIRDLVILIGKLFLTWKLGKLIFKGLGALSKGLLKIGELFTKLGEKVSGFGSKFQKLPDGILVRLNVLFTKLGGLLGRFGGWVAKIGTMLSVKGPIGIGIAALVTFAISRFSDLFTKSESFRTGLERIGRMFKPIIEGFQNVISTLTNFFVGLGGLALDKLSGVGDVLSGIGDAMLSLLPDGLEINVRNVLDGIGNAFSGLFDTILGFIDKLDLDFVDLLTTLAGIGLLFTPAAPFGVALLGIEGISLAIRGVGAISDRTWNTMATAVGNSMNQIDITSTKSMKSLEKAQTNAAKNLETSFGNASNNFTTSTSTAFNNFKKNLVNIKEENAAKFEEMKTKWSESWENFKTRVADGWGTFKQNIADAVAENKIKWEEMKAAWLEGWNKFKEKCSEVWDSFKQRFVDAIESGKIKWEEMKTAWREGWEGFKTKAKEILGIVKDKWQELTDKWKTGLDNFKTLATKVWDGFKTKAKESIDKVIDFFENMINGIVGGINRAIDVVNKVKLPDWLGGKGFNIKHVGTVDFNKNNSGRSVGSVSSRSISRSLDSIGSRSVNMGSIPPVANNALPFSNTQAQQSQASQQEITINNVMELDGKVIYENQRKIQAKKGLDFGNVAFSR